MRRLTAYIGAGDEGIEVNTRNRIDCIDRRQRVGAAAFGRARDRNDIRDVGRELHQHRRPRDFFDPFRDHAGVVGHLANSASHAALAHAVRASEIELEAVRSRVLSLFYDVVPRFALRLDHQGRDDGVIRITLLHLRDLTEIYFNRTIADELDIVETHHAPATPIDGRVTG